MTESVYKVIELVGTSTESWEAAASAAVATAAKSLRDLRIAEISELDMQNGSQFTSNASIKLKQIGNNLVGLHSFRLNGPNTLASDTVRATAPYRK